MLGIVCGTFDSALTPTGLFSLPNVWIYSMHVPLTLYVVCLSVFNVIVVYSQRYCSTYFWFLQLISIIMIVTWFTHFRAIQNIFCLTSRPH